MATEEELDELRDMIVSVARTEHEIRDLLWELMRSDWDRAFKQDIIHCGGCWKGIPRCKSIEVGDHRYCFDCFEFGIRATCNWCHSTFTRPIGEGMPICYECKQAICCMCKQKGTTDEFKIICSQCMVDKQLTEQCLREEQIRVNAHLSRARSLKLTANLSLRQWLQTLEYFNWRCAYCEGSYDVVEHFIPLSSKLAGTTQSNCVPSCVPCNTSKRNRLPAEITSIPREVIDRVQRYLYRFS